VLIWVFHQPIRPFIKLSYQESACLNPQIRENAEQFLLSPAKGIPMFKFILALTGLIIMTTATPANAADTEENTLHMEVSSGGTVTMELFPDLAPQHVARIKQLAEENFYDGIVFHRVIPGFMAQTGDPTGTGSGGSSYPDLPAEFSDYKYRRGTVGMARTSSPNSANSQFFICFTDDGCDFLTGQYTVLAQVTDGMEHIDAIAKGEPPADPDKIVSMTVASEAAE
jgi:peptidylprolyl isomerase